MLKSRPFPYPSLVSTVSSSLPPLISSLSSTRPVWETGSHSEDRASSHQSPHLLWSRNNMTHTVIMIPTTSPLLEWGPVVAVRRELTFMRLKQAHVLFPQLHPLALVCTTSRTFIVTEIFECHVIFSQDFAQFQLPKLSY
jgi:hypothetical protein